MTDWAAEISVFTTAEGMHAQIRIAGDAEDSALLGCQTLADRLIAGREHLWRVKPEVQKYLNFEEPPSDKPFWRAYARFSVVNVKVGDAS